MPMRPTVRVCELCCISHGRPSGLMRRRSRMRERSALNCTIQSSGPQCGMPRLEAAEGDARHTRRVQDVRGLLSCGWPTYFVGSSYMHLTPPPLAHTTDAIASAFEPGPGRGPPASRRATHPSPCGASRAARMRRRDTRRPLDAWPDSRAAVPSPLPLRGGGRNSAVVLERLGEL